MITGLIDRANSQAFDPVKVLAALQEKILSKGPHDEEASPASSVNLTSEEFERIRGIKAKAAIVMHYSKRFVAGAGCRSEIAVRKNGNRSDRCYRCRL